MTILVVMPDRDHRPVVEHLKSMDSQLEIRIWPDDDNSDDITCVLSWHHPHGELSKYNNLQLIHSFGAGVDHLLSDNTLPPKIPICRVVDPGLSEQMNQYLLGITLAQRFQLAAYKEQQSHCKWQSVERNPGNRVGIMGLGQLGESASRAFLKNGFEVHGWSRSEKAIPGVVSHTGESGLITLAQQVDYLICLLPLTKKTKGILRSKIFSSMPNNGYLINVGRGEHLVEQDLVVALENKIISGACLDVTTEEPLPTTSRLWHTSGVTITPHISSLTNPKVVATQLLTNYRSLLKNEPLHNQVDRNRGY